VHELERISLSAYRAVYGPDAASVGSATCLRAPYAPDSPMLNRVVGLGLPPPVDESQLDEALAAMGDTTFYVDVSPGADPALDGLLRVRGLEEGWGWMLFERGPQPPPEPETSLDVVEVAAAESAAAWARVVVDAYGLPETALATIAAVPGLDGWTAFAALEDDRPVAAAAVWVEPPAAYFGFAATHAGHRGKGGQTVLFTARIAHALAAGCTTLVTETGELRDGSPSASYRNILRMGFEARFVVSHRVRIRPST
jgi:GNAT superfamily N-acetyltransferase